MKTRLVLVAILFANTVGCATVFDGTKQTVRFSAVPEGADVRVEGKFLGQAPTEADLERGRTQNVVMTKAGFEEQRVQVRTQPSMGWFFWDIGSCVFPIALCIPVIVDAISGAWFHFDDEYRVKLDPSQKAKRPAAQPSTTDIGL